MCSIAGTIDATAERAAARVGLLNDAQAHRGPDHTVITRVGGITLGNSPAYRIPNGCWPRCVQRWPLQRASTGEDARVERNGPEPEAGCQLPHADASSKEREKPKGRPMRERTQDQSSSDLDRHENSACRKTAVLVLNWNNAAATLDCLACLQADASELQAVAIDNGSSDGSAGSDRTRQS